MMLLKMQKNLHFQNLVINIYKHMPKEKKKILKIL